WMSGLSRTPGKRVQGNTLTRVRIPPSPPRCLKNPLIFKGFFFFYAGWYVIWPAMAAWPGPVSVGQP
ncbi:hypothetical protein, partial [Zoogloea sp.]|uniref:hypothetical protein n=1 Tax=Zoogloea sp. TaxID=49181 RepID=UPI0026293334